MYQHWLILGSKNMSDDSFFICTFLYIQIKNNYNLAVQVLSVMKVVGLESLSWVKIGLHAQNFWSQKRKELAFQDPSVLSAPQSRSGCLWHTGAGW